MMKTPKTFKLYAAFAAALLMATAMTPGVADAASKLRVTTPNPDGDFVVQGLKKFKELLDKSAPGVFEITVHPGATLIAQGSEVPAAQRGNVEMFTLSTFLVADNVPELSLFNAAYLIENPKHMDAVFNGPIGAAYKKKVVDKMNIKILAACYMGTRNVNLRTVRNVKTPADLKGVNLRLPGSPDWMLMGRGLGVNPTPMNFSEVYLAIQTGAVDGQDNPHAITIRGKIFEVTKEVSLTGHLVQVQFHAMSNKFFTSQSAENQKKIQQASLDGCAFSSNAIAGAEAKDLQFLKDKGLKITQPDVGAFRKAMWDNYAKEGKLKLWDAETIKQIRALAK